MNSQHVNLAGIGAGPFNLSVAALLNKVSGMQAAFFDKKPSFNWHPGLMLDDAKLQTSWMKDLVTPADPTSPFSFLNFLVQKGRFYSFINAEQSAISRQEFAQYLAWVAEQLPSAQFGSHVREINYKQNKFWLRFDDKIISADHLCVGTGTQPFVPSFANDFLGSQVFHGGQILNQKRNFAGKKVVVVGGGQTGAEVFLNLMQGQWGGCYSVHWLSRRENFEQLDESPFTNDVFTPDYVRYFLGLGKEEKRSVVEKQKLASDGISPSTLKDIYQALYHQHVVAGGSERFVLMPGRTLEDMDNVGSGYLLNVHFPQQSTVEQMEADIVIFCTGFKPVVPACLEPLADDFIWETEGVFSMEDNYRVKWRGNDENRIYAVNASRHHHGIVDPQTSLMAWRAAVIVNDLVGYELYRLDQPSMVQWAALPQLHSLQERSVA